MRLRSITLNNIRKFTETRRIDGIGDGLNIFCEPNETGKSTIFDALLALFYKAHGSQTQEIKALRPHAGGAPQVTVEVETAEGLFTLSKQWLSKAHCTVHRGNTLIAQSDAAEEWISRLLGGGAGDPSGLVWVRQGLTGLGGGSKKEEEAALAARADLMSSVAGEVEAVTGGHRMDVALARCQGELDLLVTKTGRAAKGGPLKSAQDEVDALEAEQAELEATVADLRASLDARKRKRRELADLEDPEAVTARRESLTRAEEAAKDAARHAERLEALARDLASAETKAKTAADTLTALREAQRELDEASGALRKAADAAQAAKADHTRAEADAEAAQSALDTATRAESEARDTDRAARAAAEAQASGERREALAKRIDEAEAARKAAEEAEALAKRGPSAKDMRGLHQLADASKQAEAVRNSSATRIETDLVPDRAGEVLIDGHPCPAEPIALRKSATITLQGLGEIRVHPGRLPDNQQAETAAAEFRAALDALGVANLAEAEAQAEAREAARTEQTRAEAQLAALAPDGLEALRTALAGLPIPASHSTDLPSPAETGPALEAASDARIQAEAKREAAQVRLSGAAAKLASAEASETAARERNDRATRAAERHVGQDEATLAEAQTAAEAECKAAREAYDAQAETTPDLAAAEAALARATAVEKNAREAIERLRPELSALDERIRIGSGDGVEERLEEVNQSLEGARAALARSQHEVALLQRLEAALLDARTGARERYFEPVAKELKPLLAMLWPDAELTWSQDTLLPDGLIRNGQPEDIDVLSGGTQEQIALMVRLAFARMLARAGRHAPVILDDALVYTDDDRIERMFNALHRQAGDLQIVVLSCRQRAFRDLGAHPLRLEGDAQ